MNIYHVSKPDEIMKTAARKIGYSGRTFKISSRIPSRLDSYWDGGSRDYFYFYQPATGEILPVGSNHPVFEADQPRVLKRLPEDLILIEHSIFCGKDTGLTFYVNPENLANYLPRNNGELSLEEKLVLVATRSLKSSYNGIKNLRLHEINRYYRMDRETWEQIKSKLISKGLLNKRGAITPEGRNSIQGYWDISGVMRNSNPSDEI